MRKRNISKAVAAAGLAAATLVSGLSFGSAAVAAPSSPRTHILQDEDGGFRLIFDNSEKYFIGSAGKPSSILRAATWQEAQEKARTLPAMYFDEKTRQIKSNGKCYGAGTSAMGYRYLGTFSCNDLAREQKFTWSDGQLIVDSDPGRRVNAILTQVQFTGESFRLEPGTQWNLREGYVSGALSGVAVESRDVAGRSAVLSGRATPGAKLLFNGGGQITVPESGEWSKTLTGLKLGSNPITVEQWVDGSPKGSPVEIDADLIVAPLAADVTWNASDSFKDAVVSGTAEKGATVEAFNDGKKVGAGQASSSTGEYSFPIDAPNVGGDATITVKQKIGADYTSESDWKTLSVRYGDAVAVTSPADDSAHDGGPITVAGTGAADARITVREKGDSTFLASGTVQVNKQFTLPAFDLDKSEHVLEVIQTSKGNNVTTAEITVNKGKSDVADPTGDVFFSNDVKQKATVRGTGVDGATITLFKGESNVEIGKTIVRNGEWSTTIDPIGAGDQKIRIEQSGIDGVQTAETIAKFGAAVTLDAPATFTNGSMTVTGTSSKGATVKIVTGGKQVDEFTVTNEDGTFSRNLTGVGSGPITLTATANSRGALTTIAADNATAPITAESVAMASHVKDGTFEPGMQTFTGRGTVGATITLNPFGFEDRYSAYDLTTTVNQWGEWTIQRGLSNTPYTLFAFKQTPQAGVTNQVLNYNLKPVSNIGEPGDLSFTNFKAGDFFNPGDQIFSGKATPGATVTLNPFGFDPRYAEYDLTTTADPKTGNWQIRRGLANTVYAKLAVKQTPAAEGRVNLIEDITVAAYGWVGTPANLTLTSHQDGTFTPGEQTFTGTATPGTKVTLYVWGQNPTNPESAIADATGKWTIKRTLANQPYPARFVQDNAGDKTAEINFPLTPTN